MMPGAASAPLRRSSTRALGTAGLRYASLLVGLVLSALIARAVGPEGRGHYYFPLLIVQTLFALLHLSLDAANVFLFSQRRVPVRDLVANAGVFALFAGAAGIGIGAVGWIVLGDSLMAGMPLGHFVVALAPLPLAFHQQYLIALLLLRGGAVTIQAIVVIGSVVQLALMGALLLVSRGTISVGTVLAVNSLTLVVQWALTVRATMRLAPVRPRFDRAVAVPALRFGLRFHAASIPFFLGARLDAYFVKHLIGLTALGYYSLALALADLVTVATDAVTATLIPRQAEMGMADAARLTARTCRLNLALAAFLSLGLVLAAYPLVTLAYGRAFLPSIVPLVLLLPGVTVSTVTRPLGYYLLRLDRPVLSSVINGSGTAVGLVLNLVLIPHLGVAGAAVATSLSSVAMACGAVSWFRRHSGLPLREVLWPGRDDMAAAWSAARLGRRA